MATSPASGPGGGSPFTSLEVVNPGNVVDDDFFVVGTPGEQAVRVISDGIGNIASTHLGDGGNSNLELIAAQGAQLDSLIRINLAAPLLRVANAVAAPADADLDASQFALWLDATPAATKLMVKAKDSGGTVRSAAIALS